MSKLDEHYEDQICFIKTLESFRIYSKIQLSILYDRRDQWLSLSIEDKELLFGKSNTETSGVYQTGGYYNFIANNKMDDIYESSIDHNLINPIKSAIMSNQLFLNNLIVFSMEIFYNYWFSNNRDEVQINYYEVLPPYFSSSEFQEVVQNVRNTRLNSILSQLKLQGFNRDKADINKLGLLADIPDFISDAKPLSFYFDSSDKKKNNIFNIDPQQITPSEIDIDKSISTLKQFYRDWCAPSNPVTPLERNAIYKKIVATAVQLFSQAKSNDSSETASLLIPGAGLSRLSVELAMNGFYSFGNEFSYHMIIGGYFMMNKCNLLTIPKEIIEPNSVPGSVYKIDNNFTIYPFVETSCNLLHRGHQIASASLPDIYVSETARIISDNYELAVNNMASQSVNFPVLNFGSLAMIAGEFVEIFAAKDEANKYDAVISCFFLDTAHNIIEYLRVIFNTLKSGGYLINVGPLMYHFASDVVSGELSKDYKTTSIELSLDELIGIALRIGFQIYESPSLIPTTYTGNPASMKIMMYNAAFFVLRKP